MSNNRQLPVRIEQAIEGVLKVRVVKKSSWIKGLSYNRVLEELSIDMSGRVYTYEGVPWSTAKTLFEAKSYGKAYNRLIKGQFRSI